MYVFTDCFFGESLIVIGRERKTDSPGEHWEVRLQQPVGGPVQQGRDDGETLGFRSHCVWKTPWSGSVVRGSKSFLHLEILPVYG